MHRVTSRRMAAAVTAADLFALNQRGRFASYTQYADDAALQRSFQCAPLATRLSYEERAAAIAEERDRTRNVEETLLPSATSENTP